MALAPATLDDDSRGVGPTAVQPPARRPTPRRRDEPAGPGVHPVPPGA